MYKQVNKHKVCDASVRVSGKQLYLTKFLTRTYLVKDTAHLHKTYIQLKLST